MMLLIIIILKKNSKDDGGDAWMTKLTNMDNPLEAPENNKKVQSKSKGKSLNQLASKKKR